MAEIFLKQNTTTTFQAESSKPGYDILILYDAYDAFEVVKLKGLPHQTHSSSRIRFWLRNSGSDCGKLNRPCTGPHHSNDG